MGLGIGVDVGLGLGVGGAVGLGVGVGVAVGEGVRVGAVLASMEIALATGEPNPVTRSYPVTAGKPLLPETISRSKAA